MKNEKEYFKRKERDDDTILESPRIQDSIIVDNCIHGIKYYIFTYIKYSLNLLKKLGSILK